MPFVKRTHLFCFFFLCHLLSAQKLGAFKKVMTVVLENNGYSAAVKQPFLSSLIKSGALLESMHAETHPSQPNYIAYVAGDTLGVRNNVNTDLPQKSIADLLEEKALSWKVYAEDYPGNCFLGATAGKYVRKHVPFLSFKNIQSNKKRCSNIVEASQLEKDVQNKDLSTYSLYVPNLNNDGHDTGIAYADSWLEKRFSSLLKNPDFMNGMLFIVTFDEDEGGVSNHIFTSLIGESVKKASRSTQNYNHYSLLRMIEKGLGLGDLGRKDVNANVISGVWKE